MAVEKWKAPAGAMRDAEDLSHELDRVLIRAREAGISVSERCVRLQCALEHLRQYGDQ